MKKKLIFLLLASLPLFQLTLTANKGINIVPKPVSLKVEEGEFHFSSKTEIFIPEGNVEIQQIVQMFQNRILEAGGPVMKIISSARPSAKEGIVLNLKPGSIPAEGYKMTVRPNLITLTGGSEAGLFYGIQTLYQLMPDEISRSGAQFNTFNISIPCVEITDQPRYSYRGMHLDVSRHFFPKEFIKKYIDLISRYKINTFHWHLTDDNGWRIEIKKYPKLTEIGAWHADREDQPWTERTPQRPREIATVGGFYTQNDIRDIVAYAHKHYVNIVPEIEMPAHSIEVLAAYPQLSCTGGPFTVPTGSYWPNTEILCAGNDSTFTFIQDVLSEVIELFPYKYVHVGGDEADKTRWKACKKCQARIAKEELKDEKELQSYFIKRVEKFITSRNRRMIGWDEILEGGLPPQATVMSWRGVDGGIEAARKGHDVIMTPTNYCYFDYYQANPATEPKSIGGMVTLKQVYSFDPTPAELNKKEALHIIGTQANLWSEYIPTTSHAEYMLLPRMLALAEVAWTPQESRNWDDFRARIDDQFRRFDLMKVNYSKGSFRVTAKTHFDPKQNALMCTLESEQPGFPIRYNTYGSDPNADSPEYTQPIPIKGNSFLKAGIFKDGKPTDPFLESPIQIHNAIGKKITYVKPYSSRYTGGGDEALIDGLRGTVNHRDGYWQGYLGGDMEVIIDLGKEQPIRSVGTTFLQNKNSWIFLPDSVTFSLSSDGKHFHSINEVPNVIDKKTEKPIIQPFNQIFPDTQARYIRVRAKSPGKCPSWHEGAGQDCWVFVDEIVVM